jgi:hypothetical protein
VSRSSTLSTPTKSKSPFNGNNTTNNHVPIKVDVFITYWILNQRTLMVTASGFLFDGTKDDPTFSSSDIIESFIDKYESIHKLNLPMPNHSGTDYRRIFLKNTGFDTDDNYALLTYSRCISFNPDVGDMDVTSFTQGSDKVNKRFPWYFVHQNNLANSNADEHSENLFDKFQVLLRTLKSTHFICSSKGNLNGRSIEYVYHEAENDVTNHRDSREYKQLKLLLAACQILKEKEIHRLGNSPTKITVDQSESIPLKSLKRTYDETQVTTETNVPPATPTSSTSSTSSSSVNVKEKQAKKK